MKRITLLFTIIICSLFAYSQSIPSDAITFHSDSLGNFKVTYAVDKYPSIRIEDGRASLYYYKCRIVKNDGIPNDTIDCTKRMLSTDFTNPFFIQFMDAVWTNQNKIMLRNMLLNVVVNKSVEAGGILPPEE